MSRKPETQDEQSKAAKLAAEQAEHDRQQAEADQHAELPEIHSGDSRENQGSTFQRSIFW